MRSARILACVFAALLWLAGCSSSSSNTGTTEPLHVVGAQFVAGSFPGATTSLAVGAPSTRNNQLQSGTTGKRLSGLVSLGTQAVAIGFEGGGTGYWIVPVGSPDLNTNDMLTFDVTCDFSRDISAGEHNVLFAAVDGNGGFGPPRALTLTFLGALPQGQVLASLSWQNNADLDLHLISPSGKELDPKHPNSVPLPTDGLTAPADLPGNGTLDHDSNAACLIDGARRETVVWRDAPEPGAYLVRVDMFNSCREPSANFVFSLYVDGVEVQKVTGRLLDIDADGGGAGSGLFVASFNCDGNGKCS